MQNYSNIGRRTNNDGGLNITTFIKNMSKSEIRALIRFLHANNNSPTRIFVEIILYNVKDVMSKR